MATKTYNTEQAFSSGKNQEAQAQNKVAEEIDKYLINAMELLHSEKTRDSMFELIMSKPDPIESMSDAVTLILNRLDTDIRRAGIEVSDAARLASSFEITAQVIELAVSSGELEEPTEEEGYLVLAVAMEKYIKGEIEAGRMDKDKLAAEVNQMIQYMDPEEKEAMIESMEKMDQTVKKRAGKMPLSSPHMVNKGQGQQQGQGAQQGQQQGQQQQSALGGA